MAMVNLKAVLRREVVETNGMPEIVDEFATKSFHDDVTVYDALIEMREAFPNALFFEAYIPVTDAKSQTRY